MTRERPVNTPTPSIPLPKRFHQGLVGDSFETGNAPFGDVDSGREEISGVESAGVSVGSEEWFIDTAIQSQPNSN
ncbi:MAG: hypothetical protein AAFO82_17070 [Bacteroidota bacterium]